MQSVTQYAEDAICNTAVLLFCYQFSRRMSTKEQNNITSSVFILTGPEQTSLAQKAASLLETLTSYDRWKIPSKPSTSSRSLGEYLSPRQCTTTCSTSKLRPPGATSTRSWRQSGLVVRGRTCWRTPGRSCWRRAARGSRPLTTNGGVGQTDKAERDNLLAEPAQTQSARETLERKLSAWRSRKAQAKVSSLLPQSRSGSKDVVELVAEGKAAHADV